MKEATVRLLFELEKKCDFDLITRTTKIDRTGTVTRTFDIKTRTTYSRTRSTMLPVGSSYENKNLLNLSKSEEARVSALSVLGLGCLNPNQRAGLHVEDSKQRAEDPK